MYGPAPSRVNKTGITRSRLGCLTCRRRRKKCDEKRPCSSCQKLGIPCQQPTKKLAFRPVSFTHDPDSNLPGTSSSVTAQAESEPSAQTPEASQDGASLSNTAAGTTEYDWLGPLDNQFTSFLDDPACQTGSLGFINTPSILDTNIPYDDCVISPSLLNISGLAQSREGSSPDCPEKTDGNDSPTSPQSQLVLPVDNDCQLSMATSRTFGQLVFYSGVWDTHCLLGLHPALRGLGRSWQMPDLLKDAVLALAACQLSRMKPQKKSFDPKSIPGLSFRPDLDHQAVACEKYGSTLMRLASWSDMANAQAYNEALTGMILLAHLELLMGDFRQFASHQTGIDALLSQLDPTNALPDYSTCQLIATWTQARAQNWWLRFHFSTPDHHRRGPSMACSPWLTSVLERAQDPRSIVMITLCECCRLSSITFLSWWDRSSNLDFDNGAAAAPIVLVEEPPEQHAYFKVAQTAENADIDISSISTIASLRATLDRWHQRLPHSQLPIESFMEPPDSAFPDETLNVRPLRFNAHQSAMNYAYYVVCRLLLCSCELYSTKVHTSSPQRQSVNQDINLWALLLARIAAGLEWDECLILNRYVIGLTSLFLPVVLQSSEPRIGLWLQDWIEQRYTSTALEEGSFPVLQVLQPLRAVNREYRQGRDTKALYTCVEDEGGRGKYDSYNSQHIPSLLAYGHDCSTDQYFSESLWL